MLAGSFAIPVETALAADQKQPAYVASANREPFHKPACEWAKKISAKNLEAFKSREEAVKAGHRPCKVCRP
jgi:methylphosphotriester-DNA--protein-cysteine methyltransferase